jgi:hypothetical protein
MKHGIVAALLVGAVSLAWGPAQPLAAAELAAQDVAIEGRKLLDGRITSLSSRGESAPAPLPTRVTAEFDNLNLVEAAKKLSEALGTQVTVSERGEDPKPGAGQDSEPRLDYERRVRLTWKDVPVGEALREFCRKYGCLLARDGGSLRVYAGWMPGGPVQKAGSFAIEINRITFSDYRSSGDEPADLTLRRALGLQFCIRGAPEEMPYIQGLENVRVLDQNGRDVLDSGGAGGGFGLPNRTLPNIFPDERLQSLSFEWPYPTPQRLRLVEGDLVLHQTVKRSTVEVAIPEGGKTRAAVPLGEGQLQFAQATFQDGNFHTLVQVLQPPNVDLQVAGTPARLTLMLEDGTQAFATGSMTSWGVDNGWINGYVTINARDLKSRPVKVLWDMLWKSEATRRVHFRFDNYPTQISKGSGQWSVVSGQSPAKNRPRSTKRPAPKAQGRMPKAGGGRKG